MSVVAYPAGPEPSDTVTGPPSGLHLVSWHDHAWELRSVDYDEAFEVRRYECTDCDEVLFR